MDDSSFKRMLLAAVVFWGALIYIHPSHLFLFLASAGLCFLLLLVPPTLSDIRKWIVCRKWKGYAGATIKEIKGGQEKVYYGKWFYRWKRYEYPVVTYQVGEETYVYEYSYAKKGPGVLSIGQAIPILYNDRDPKEFIFQGAYSEDDLLGLFSSFVFFPGLCLACLVFTLHFFGYFLDTRTLLYDPETGYMFSDTFGDFQTHYPTEHPSFVDGLEETTKETTQHFIEMEATIRNMGRWRYDAYRKRYERAAVNASRQLANIYSQGISQLSAQYDLGDGWKDEQETVWQSAYSDYLRRICPQIAPEAGRYSIEELAFMLKILLMTSGRDPDLTERDDPEESIGLSFAATFAGYSAAASALSYDPSIQEKIEQRALGCIPFLIEEVDKYLVRCQRLYGDEEAYPPLDREAIYAVYSYTMERYHDTGSFETALWDGAVFAREHLLARVQADPSLKKLARFQPENDPLSGFDPQIGPVACFHPKEEPEELSPGALFREQAAFIRDNQSRHNRFYKE